MASASAVAIRLGGASTRVTRSPARPLARSPARPLTDLARRASPVGLAPVSLVIAVLPSRAGVLCLPRHRRRRRALPSSSCLAAAASRPGAPSSVPRPLLG
ncbi:hypothetical protein DCS_06314 [Drechmeria coniospora]|uniref:Uncharacterized protein n=1 Tax=Drechmeria coniospora TaxID=98403 RepID=A0A151GB76_DRECN|nr:hypothetical protein DCS_06314 [Drechmeria coniospora]KYK54357.1 hypothetical protein DCS_06314 [Drechmeria coniospora]ODA77356.1 hypothetical protein RJ55_06984 [Drechmeria coniospora]